jgi:hypothetical protein
MVREPLNFKGFFVVFKRKYNQKADEKWFDLSGDNGDSVNSWQLVAPVCTSLHQAAPA